METVGGGSGWGIRIKWSQSVVGERWWWRWIRPRLAMIILVFNWPGAGCAGGLSKLTRWGVGDRDLVVWVLMVAMLVSLSCFNSSLSAVNSLTVSRGLGRVLLGRIGDAPQIFYVFH